jgi:hypothetical protein
MKNSVAFTICAINYLPKALVLFESYHKYHPENQFYIVLVDRKVDDLVINRPGLTIIWVEDLGIENLRQHAFAFDVIELSTNVKPASLLYLLSQHDVVLYIDPDIKIYASLESVYNALQTSSVVVTPHTNLPVIDGAKPDDVDLLRFGAFNLGFVGVSRSEEGIAFARWWSERCLAFGFYEPQLGLAVDQKWVDLAPAFFPSLRILHDPGLNVAFWNLHERTLSRRDGMWWVNDVVPLRFIHFSSFDAKRPDVIAYKQSRFAPGSRPDFQVLATEYAVELQKEGSDEFVGRKYGFDYFADGTYITPALRRFYAGLKEQFAEVVDPFDPAGRVMEFAKKRRLLTKGNAAAKRHTFHDVSQFRGAIKIIHLLLRLALRFLGPNRYYMLMRYISHISSLRNQAEMFGRVE